MGAILGIAFRNLRQARLRTALLGAALALVTALLIVMMSISQGFSDTMIKHATALASGHVNIAGFYKSKPTDAWPMITDVERLRKIAEANTPGLVELVTRDRAWAKVIGPAGSMYVSPSGIDIATEHRLRESLRLAPEREYREGGSDEVKGDIGRLSEPHSVLLFAGQAKRLGVGVGDQLTITSPTGSGRTNTVDVNVVAVARDLGMMSNWFLFLCTADVHELYELAPGTSSVIMLYLKEPRKAEEVMGQLRLVLEREGFTLMDHRGAAFFMKFEEVGGEDWTGQRLDLTTWEDEVSYASWVSTALDAISYTLVAVLMAIIAIGIMNTLWIAVRERTREIGTARAIGMTRGRVLALFVLEAALLGLFGTTLGALCGAALAFGLDAAHIGLPDAVRAILMSDVLELKVTAGQLGHAIWIFTLITALAALGPALRASRLEPVTAMGHAG